MANKCPGWVRFDVHAGKSWRTSRPSLIQRRCLSLFYWVAEGDATLPSARPLSSPTILPRRDRERKVRAH